MKKLTLLAALSFELYSAASYSNDLIPCEFDNGNTSLSISIGKSGTIHREFKVKDEVYTVHINDINNLSEVDDYVTVEDNKGNTMTYPLICK